ncbi:MAG: DUF4190 domain-containing protein [Candidatus Nanopelagicales bacterium]
MSFPTPPPDDDNPFAPPPPGGSLPPPPPPPPPPAPSQPAAPPYGTTPYGAPPPGSTPPPPPPPPAPPAYYGAPGYAAPYGQGYAAPENGNGTAALVLGIVGIVLSCCYIGVIASIVAIVLGRKGMALADQGRATNRGMAQAGLVLGIIGVVLLVLVVVFAIASGGTRTSFNFGS